MSNCATGRRWRLFLADDHEAMLAVVKDLLHARYDVVGTACDGETVLDFVAALAPDVVVMDISMPRLNGVKAAERLKDSGTRAKLIFLTVYGNPEFIRSAFAAGALGYVIKHRLMTDLPLAIEAALEGKRFISPSLVVP